MRLLRLQTGVLRPHKPPSRFVSPRKPPTSFWARFATTSAGRDGPQGKVSPNDNFASYQQLVDACRTPLGAIAKQLSSGATDGRNLGKNCPLLASPDPIAAFTESLHRQFDEYTRNSGPEKDPEEVLLAEFINPQLRDASRLVLAVLSGRTPTELCTFYGHTLKSSVLEAILSKLLQKHQIAAQIVEPGSDFMVDLANPAEWFPAARRMRRKLVMHVGPTNSGKTHASLQKLAKARSGYYAGPLRLLAREIYERFNADGVRCNLITGEEVVPCIDASGKVADLLSGTIEMIPLNRQMDVCVIDEIQMMADEKRGSSWTSAVLGVQAKEVHMCGEERSVSLVERIAAVTGDELEIRRYQRLGKLTVARDPVGRIQNLQKGDCVVAFSKRKILDLKCSIERDTDLKAGVIYGALPPEIRSTEAARFNSGAYDVLVASDAIGMGLNLKIKRVVFWATDKFDGSAVVPLSALATKQIGGRAGRYSSVDGELEGVVTAFRRKDLKFVREMMKETIPDIVKACVWPTKDVWTAYMARFPPNTLFYDVLHQFEKDTKGTLGEDYFLSDLEDRYNILKLFLEDDLYRKTTIDDQLVLSLSPLNVGLASPLVLRTAFRYFDNVAKLDSRTVFDFDFLHRAILLADPAATDLKDAAVKQLEALEENHKLVLMFLWLSQRWPTLFVDKESATDIKTLIEKRISEELLNLRRLLKDDRQNPKSDSRKDTRNTFERQYRGGRPRKATKSTPAPVGNCT